MKIPHWLYFRLPALLLILAGATDLYSDNNQTAFPAGRWVDLTHDFSEETIYWPTSDVFRFDVVFAGMTEKGYYYAANKFATAEHGGTHVDAPIHFFAGRHTVDRIPLERLIGPAVVIDVTARALKNSDYEINVRDFKAWERNYGKIPENAIVLLKTGYGRYWPDRNKYMGTDERGAEAVKKLHFPGLSPKAAQWLVDNRNIASIGLDTPSIDFGQSTHYQSHQILFEDNIPAFENVANLDQLPATGATVIALPMKIKGGSGGPLRIVALVPDSN